ncbi:helix-turn-helix domain-containing protein [Streptomyces sp. NPDC048717]|uniref:helix-turn-helix domain-containing protein n=1 Tax=Streptomyces sp. NPDC048717 TaxID=3154928 RepID=UPI00342F873D
MASDIPERAAPDHIDITAAPPGPAERAFRRAVLSQTRGAVRFPVPARASRTTDPGAGPGPGGTPPRDPLGPLASATQAVTLPGDFPHAPRARRLIRPDGQPRYVVFTMLERGVAQLEHDDREVLLGPGDVVVYDLARTGRADRAASAKEPAPAPLPDIATNTTTGTAVDTPVDPSAGNRALRARIHAYIDRHLPDAGLTPRTIARAHHISLRYLHKLFEGEDATVSRWIQRRRLERSRRDLARYPHVTIAAVAHRWGFASAAHFSRVFRTAYGMSPRQWRTGEEAATLDAALSVRSAEATPGPATDQTTGPTEATGATGPTEATSRRVPSPRGRV